MITNLLRDDTHQKYLLFDFESTSLNLLSPEFQLPWQCSYFICTKDRVLEKHDKYLWFENLPMSRGAAQVTKFDFNLYKQRAEDPLNVLNAIEKYFYDESYLICGHNIISFDVPLHNIWRKKLGKKTDYSYINRCFDTNSWSKALFLERKPAAGESLIAFQYKMSSIIKKGLKTNLAAMGKHFDIQFDANLLHNSLFDLELNYKLLQKLLYSFDI